MDRKHEGKRGGTQSSEQHEQPRPGNRDEDPRRDPSRYEQLPVFFAAKRKLLRDALADTPLELLPCAGSYFQLARYHRISDEPATDDDGNIVVKLNYLTDYGEAGLIRTIDRETFDSILNQLAQEGM